MRFLKEMILTLLALLGGISSGMADLGDPSDQATSISFAKKQITLGQEHIEAQIAETPAQLERGLMFRKRDLKDSEGMLFIFKRPQILKFWMKNTNIPLSVGYFDSEKRLLEVIEMKPASTIEVNPYVYSSHGEAQYALEVSPGWFSRHKIKIKTQLKGI